VYHSLNSVIFS